VVNSVVVEPERRGTGGEKVSDYTLSTTPSI